jgi:hypothetical protein
MTTLNLIVLPQLWISWTPGAAKFFHIHHTFLIWHHWTAICFQRLKSTSEVSNSTPVKMFKIKSRNHNMSRAHFFSDEGLGKLTNCCDKYLNRFGAYVEK